MGTSLFVGLLLAGFGGEPPDGQLALGVVGQPGEWAVVADPRTGLTRKRRLSGGTLCHGPLLAVGDRVVFSGYGGGRAVVRTLPLSLSGPARSLGYADTFTPSSHGRLWLGNWQRPRGRVLRWSNRPVSVKLREVGAGGEVSARVNGLMPRFASLHAALGGTFLTTEGRRLALRRPGHGPPLLRVRDGWFVAAGNARFAWCRGSCLRFHVWSLGGARTLSPPAGIRPLGSEGAFSPDGRRLAAAVTVGGRTRVAVVDVRGGDWTLVPGGASGAYNAIAWSPSGRWLYFTDGHRGLRAWRLGAQRAVALPVRPGGTVMSIATAPGEFAEFSGL